MHIYLIIQTTTHTKNIIRTTQETKGHKVDLDKKTVINIKRETDNFEKQENI